MDTKALRQKILDLAIRGKLVPQDPNDEPASVLLERIRAEKQQMVKDGKLKAKDIKNDTVIFKGDDNLHYEQFQDGTVKCIEDEIPFELPDGWTWARLGKLAHYKKGPFGSSITKAMFVPESKDSIKVYEQKNAINKNDTLGNYFVTKEKYEELKGFEVFPGDIIVSCAGTIGETFVMPNSMRKGIINQALMKISLYDSSIKDFYLIYFDCKLKALANEQGYGMALKNIPPFNILKQYLVPLPPLPEQRRIIDKINIVSNVLSAIDNHMDKLSIDISNVKSKILDLAIRGKLVPQDPNDEPASVLLERIRAEKEELIKSGKIKRDKKESVIFKGDDNSYYRTNGKTIESCDNLPFDLPEGWIWTSLGQYCEKVTDQVASGSFAALRENVVSLKEPSYALMVKTADFSNGFTKNLTYTDKHGYEFLENSNLFGGELILSNIGSIGKVFIVPDLNCKMTLAPNSVMIRLTNNEYRDYLYYFLQSPTGYEELKAISTGVAMLKFNKTDLKTIYLPSPPLAEQKRIVEAIETAFAQIDKIAEQIS